MNNTEIETDITYKKITLARLEDLVRKQVNSPYIQDRKEMIKVLKEQIIKMEASISG